MKARWCLKKYAIFIDRVRTLSAKVRDFPSAINQAIDECICEGILTDLLTEQRAEVHEVIQALLSQAALKKQ